MINWSRRIQLSGKQVGALVVYPPSQTLMPIWSATIRFMDAPEKDGMPNLSMAMLQEHKSDDGKTTVRAAVFPSLAPGKYQVYQPGSGSIFKKEINIRPGMIEEVRW